MRILLALSFSLSAFAQGSSVTLNWPASPTPGVTGYNVWKLSGPCPTNPTGFAKITAVPLTVRTYTDANIAAGVYCYYATAVAGALESVPSPTASASVVPAPPPGLTINVTVAVNVTVDGKTVTAKEVKFDPVVVGQ